MSRDDLKAEFGQEQEKAGGPHTASHSHRAVSLTPASTIKIRPVHWLWQDRIPLGMPFLIAGREGIGKSTVGYQVAADTTRGVLPGRYLGQPKGVVIAATEDSWEHTIVPRLMAAGADLTSVYRVDVTTAEGTDGTLVLPSDISMLGRKIDEVDAALLLLDPLMSRLDASLDTHKDAQVRQAMEPLSAMADRHKVAIGGLIHVNKSTSTDPLTLIMASRAFAAVARAVLFVMTDPEDETIRLLGQPKNNLGRTDLPTLTFRIDNGLVADTEEGPVSTGRICWLGETDRSIRDALDDAGGDLDARSATSEAGDWLSDHLAQLGGSDDSKSVKDAGSKAGHSQDALKRARRRLRIDITSSGFPRRTYWSLPGTQPDESAGHDQSEQNHGESAPTALTAPTALAEPQSVQSEQSEQSPRASAPTEQLSITPAPENH